MNIKNEYRISFNTVRGWYKRMQIYYSPLLEPIDKIEGRLKEHKFLSELEHFIRFDAGTEEFVVAQWKDGRLQEIIQNKKLSLWDKIKLWLRK